MKYTVEVTEKDIRLGRMREPRKCPVARATNRALGFGAKSGRVTVFPGRIVIFLHNNERETSVDTPKHMTRWIRRFDDKGKEAVKPVLFTLNVK